MDRKIMKLRRLCQLDIDAMGTYDAALARVNVAALKEKLMEFRADHLRHVVALNHELVKLGAREVRERPDLKGALLKGFTAVTSMLGNEAALLAMVGNEALTNRTYRAALRLDWNAEQRAMLERHFNDERRHLEWIREAAKTRHWAPRREARAHL